MIVIVSVAVVAHCPEFGVNVYVVVTVLLIAGDHVPVVPFVEVVGNAEMEAPEQNGPTGLNVGVSGALIVIVKVVETAQVPPAGVNVYVVVAVLFIPGDHVPLKPLLEVVGKAGITSPEQ